MPYLPLYDIFISFQSHCVTKISVGTPCPKRYPLFPLFPLPGFFPELDIP